MRMDLPPKCLGQKGLGYCYHFLSATIALRFKTCHRSCVLLFK
eukprot:04024.XXX_193193_193321_1 [CDS] Oithona nana genome sequencing.